MTECDMANIYCKVHRLKAQGWTWDEFLSQLDGCATTTIDEKTLKALYRQPQRNVTSHVSTAIETLHAQYFPSAFPADTQALLALYENLHEQNQDASQQQNIQQLETFLNGQIQADSTATSPPARRRLARLHWIKANIHLDRIPSLRSINRPTQMANNQAQAIHHYSQALALLTPRIKTDKPLVDAFTLFKLQQNLLACHLNVLEPEQRNNSKAVQQYLKTSNYLPHSLLLLSQEPWQWSVARNGLRFSSLLQDKTQAQAFFQALVHSNKQFKNLDFEPGHLPALSQSTEFAWAITHALNTENP